MYNITIDQMRQILIGYKNVSQVVNFVNEKFSTNQFDTAEKVAQFFAQTCAESANWTVTDENLNYSTQALLTVFPTHFSGLADAEAYARQPVRIANRVYANRMGNGDELSGDGWNFRGRGIIQITGRTNYTIFANSRDEDTDDAIMDIETDPTGPIDVGFWYWQTNNLTQYGNDVQTVTRVINGGLNGLAIRQENYDRIYPLL
jgi:putative chitinase